MNKMILAALIVTATVSAAGFYALKKLPKGEK